MKNIFSLLIITSLLLQSCFSYRVIDKNSNLALGKKYKIKQSNRYENVRLLSATDSTITFKNDRNRVNTMVKNDIKTIKKRHFSATKTVLLPVGVVVGVVGLFVATYSGPKVGGYMQMPP
jgi:hypothetical protein